jgi:RNA polymerase sigma-70 factor (ECF subfamily)
MAQGPSPRELPDARATENQELAGCCASVDCCTPVEQPAADLIALVKQHHAAVYRYAARLCGCPTEAEDLTQQAYLIAQQKLSQLREMERAGGWLLAIVRNCYLKSRRKARPVSAETIGLDVQQVAEKAPASEEIDRERLAAALAELPDEFRTIVLMFYFEELSYQQIAEQLEIPIGTVMSRLSRGKGHLRRWLVAMEGKPAIPAPHLAPARQPALHSGAVQPPGMRVAT